MARPMLVRVSDLEDPQRMYLNRGAIIILSMIEDGLHRSFTNTNEGRAGTTELHDTRFHPTN